MTDTTSDLIQRVKRKETIPDSGAAYSDSVLLEYLDQTVKAFLVPAIETAMEEYFVVTHDTQMATIPSYASGSPPTNVSNTISIPGESTGLRLRDVYIVGSDGSFYNLPRLTPTQAASQSFGSPWFPVLNTGNSNQFFGGFFLQGNTLQIFPYGLASGKIVRITYQRSPSDLCLTSDAGQVTAITGDVVTLDKVLQWSAGTAVNAISAKAPYDFVQDATIPVTVYTSYTPLNNMLLVSSAANVITLPPGTGANIQLGDWICPAGQSVFAQNIPRELLPTLVQKAACMCIHAAGDSEGYKVAQAEYTEMLKMAMLQITPRIIGKPIKVIATNSPFKASRGAGYGRW